MSKGPSPAQPSIVGEIRRRFGGDLFLDEIAEMTAACQAKSEGPGGKEVTPLGSEKPLPSDTRIIAATNKNLPEMMSEKKFREDLYYRLCGIESHPLPSLLLHLPPPPKVFLNKWSMLDT